MRGPEDDRDPESGRDEKDIEMAEKHGNVKCAV
jgi:hypothetical protein